MTPSKFLLGVEGIRGMYEYALAWSLSVPLNYISPKGDGHPVLVIPGLGGADGSTYYLRQYLDGLGYTSFPWGQGRNLGPRNGLDEMSNRLVNLIRTIFHDTHNQPVSIIGWSLGGIYAREIAKLCPESVRQVITLGTPFKFNAGRTNADKLYEILSKDNSHKDPFMIQQVSTPPPVPFTSIYSKTDGVVFWKCSIETPGPIAENIEVPGASHLGLGHNPISMFLIANRLQQHKDNWIPFESDKTIHS